LIAVPLLFLSLVTLIFTVMGRDDWAGALLRRLIIAQFNQTFDCLQGLLVSFLAKSVVKSDDLALGPDDRRNVELLFCKLARLGKNTFGVASPACATQDDVEETADSPAEADLRAIEDLFVFPRDLVEEVFRNVRSLPRNARGRRTPGTTTPRSFGFGITYRNFYGGFADC